MSVCVRGRDRVSERERVGERPKERSGERTEGINRQQQATIFNIFN